MRKANIFQRLAAFLIDSFTVIFLLQMVAFLLSPFYFIPFFPGLWFVWTVYYIVSYCTFGKTLGESFFNAQIVANKGFVPVWIKIILREAFTSFPALIAWTLCWNQFVAKRSIAIFVVLLLLICLRRKMFGISLVKREQDTIATKRPFYQTSAGIFLMIILGGVLARVVNTLCTNDKAFLVESPLKAVPRPTANSVSQYVDYLNNNRQDINDYVLGLFEKYDYVVLCERLHKEMTQYDMIYDLVTDSRFVDKVGVVFTEIGCAESRDAYRTLVETTFPNDTLLEKGLASFLMENQTVHLLWPNTNWFTFLKRMYYFNHDREKKVEILFADRNWIDRTELAHRDSVMADNIIKTIESDSLKKSLIIMNYRHAFFTPGCCGEYIQRRFPGKVANVMINNVKLDFLSLALGKEIARPDLRHGEWNVAFEQMPTDAFAFDLKDSPFGKDNFDYFALPWAMENGMQYQDMFNGFIYYKSLIDHRASVGFNHLFDPENRAKLEERERLLPGYWLGAWEFLKEGPQVTEGKDIYFEYNKSINIIFLWICLAALLLGCLMSVVNGLNHVHHASKRDAAR
ncbi:MAG: RDD family protein [Prevotella sp.]|nr:RDD family protein [Prevotella sp.]